MIDQLIRSIQQKNNATVVGLDPRLNFVPEHIKEEAYGEHGKTLKGASEALLQFNKIIIDNVHDLIPAVKPQIAMYEQYGVEGIKAYLETISYAKEKGLLIIGDIKRSDIASTAMAYSDGHIGRVQVEDEAYEVYQEDFITLNPFLGFDSIEPYMDNCKNYDRGLFLLVKTSNPNSGEIQDLLVDGTPIYTKVGELVDKWGREALGESGYSRVGAVVGATHPKQSKELRKVMPRTFFLVPGYGAQGATAEDLAGCFNLDGLGAIVNSSRGIIAAYTKEPYKNKFTSKEFGLAAREAVIAMRDDLNRVR